MKRNCLLLIVALLFSLSNAFSQEANNVDLLSEKTPLKLVGRFGDCSVRVFRYKGTDSLVLCIGLLDDLDGNINLKYLRVEPEDWASFESKMAVVDEKFSKWAETARKENVKNFRKVVPVDFENIVGRFSFGYRGYYETPLYAVFEVNENGKSILRLVDNEDYDRPSSLLWFYSPQEFHDLYELIRFDNASARFLEMESRVKALEQAEKDRDAKFD
ncbi:MAG: hypothetical protein J6N56_01555 [Bacteroidales bacterium]|nr:hypothetical protein [Bacteroidales bacterium]